MARKILKQNLKVDKQQIYDGMTFSTKNTYMFELDGAMVVQLINTSRWLSDNEWISYFMSNAKIRKPHIKDWKVCVVKKLKKVEEA
mgnify:CR=1 FL=1